MHFTNIFIQLIYNPLSIILLLNTVVVLAKDAKLKLNESQSSL